MHRFRDVGFFRQMAPAPAARLLRFHISDQLETVRWPRFVALQLMAISTPEGVPLPPE
jgi:hypothetical protein